MKTVGMVAGTLLVAGTLVVHGEPVVVERVIDGDTFVTTDGTRVRVKSIDTPETKHPTKRNEPGGERATQLAKEKLEGKIVELDGDRKDKYGRRVAEVTLSDGESYAAVIRAQGLDKNADKGQTLKPTPGIAGTTSVTETGRAAGLRNGPDLTSKPDVGNGRVAVRGYVRSDGTYVAPYTRSAPASRGR
jgi:hypothetical protein